MAVSFHSIFPTTLSNKKKLKDFLELLFYKYKRELESLDIIFCSDEYLLEINQTHLSHDYYTDIITFDLSPNKKAATIGELYISIERVKENALTNHTSFKNELHRVIFHGTLHLLGFMDKKKEEIIIMRQKEEECLTAYFNL
jgi:probable rRNA maturation factor